MRRIEQWAELRPFEDNPNRLPTDEDLNQLQWTDDPYTTARDNPDNGLVRESRFGRPSSIAAVGFCGKRSIQ